MKADRLWTPEEVEYLHAHYEQPIEEIAKALRRTISSIANKAQREGLKRPKPRDKAKFILENINKMPEKDIAKALGMALPTVYWHINRLQSKGLLSQVTSLCGICAKATPLKCLFMRAPVKKLAAALEKMGVEYTGTYRVLKCPNYELGELPPLVRRKKANNGTTV